MDYKQKNQKEKCISPFAYNIFINLNFAQQMLNLIIVAKKQS